MVYDFGAARRRRSAVRPSPVFLGFLAAAVAAGVVCWSDETQGSVAADLAVFVFVLCAWVVSLSLHEFAHAYAAFRGGDHSVEAAGYLTLNPFKYTHPVLSILLPLIFIIEGGIGLPGGAVYLHRHSLRSKRAQSITAAAGPMVNVVLAVVTLIIVGAHFGRGAIFPAIDQTGNWTEHTRFWAALAFFGLLQVTAAVLNLLPVPGLDGWAIIEPYVDPETARAAEKIKPWGFIIVIVAFQVTGINEAFFHLVYTIYEGLGPSRGAARLGHEFFKFWQKNAL